MEQIIRLEEKLHQADLDIKDGYFEAAFEKLQDILSEDPTFGKAHNHLGFLNETKFRNYDQAERHYKLALDMDAGYQATYYNYAVLLSLLRKWDELSVLLEKALTVRGINQSTIYNEYGIMKEQNALYDEAMEYYKKSIQANFDKNGIQLAKESIERCKMKKNLD